MSNNEGWDDKDGMAGLDENLKFFGGGWVDD